MAFSSRSVLIWGFGLALAALSAGQPWATAAESELAAGFRKLEGRHITLITDVPSSPEVDELPQAFDAAFPEWCEYFQLDARRHADWHVTGYLMQSKERFQQAGYWRDNLPPFPNGFSTGKELWLYNQTSPYYRRHLLLHEGVHSFMYLLIGTAGPPWYMEGIAELLATHRWHDGQLTVGYFPRDVAEVPGLGRIKLVQDDVAAGKGLSAGQVLAYDSRVHLQVQPYAWSWALSAFLDGHPRYRDRFRQAAELVRKGNFAPQFRQLFAADWPLLVDEWRVFTANLDYGYDLERMAIDFRPGKPLAVGSAEATVAADRGWQSSGVQLDAGKKYRIRARGRYQIGDKPRTWWCEPGGVTIRYNHGRPLGMLLAAIRPDTADQPDAPASEPMSLAEPSPVGLETVLAPQRSGTLYFRINEPAGELADNVGELKVDIQSDAGAEASDAPVPARRVRGPRLTGPSGQSRRRRKPGLSSFRFAVQFAFPARPVFGSSGFRLVGFPARRVSGAIAGFPVVPPAAPGRKTIGRLATHTQVTSRPFSSD